MDAQVVTHNAVHADLLVGAGVVREHDADRLLAALALEDHGVAAEELQLVHFRLQAEKWKSDQAM